MAPAPASNTGSRSKRKNSKSKHHPPAKANTTTTIPTPPASGNKTTDTTAFSTSTTDTITPGRGVKKTEKAASISQTVSSLKVSTEKPATETHNSSSDENGKPPTSAKVISSLSSPKQDQHQHQHHHQHHQHKSSKQKHHQEQPLPPKKPFSHKVISISPGAQTVISEEILKEALEFLQLQVSSGKKVLVHCRDGNGRSGSIAIAFLASQLQQAAMAELYQHQKKQGKKKHTEHQQKQQQKQQQYPPLSEPELEQKRQEILQKQREGVYYDQALNEVWKWKCDVYPHKHLKETLENIQW
jgi:protein-tyrosine phosphatase